MEKKILKWNTNKNNKPYCIPNEWHNHRRGGKNPPK